MTRKDYIAIATAIKNSKLLYTTPEYAKAAHNQRLRVAHGIADELKKDNSAFDRERFLEACGLPTS